MSIVWAFAVRLLHDLNDCMYDVLLIDISLLVCFSELMLCLICLEVTIGTG